MSDTLALAGDHLWQSTIFGAVVALLAIGLRRYSARVRYWLWLAASMKFFVPFAALAALGAQVTWRTAEVVRPASTAALMQTISEPFSSELSRVASLDGVTSSLPTIVPITVMSLWALGCAALLATWIGRWRRLRRVVRGSTRLDEGRVAESMRRLAPIHDVRAVPIVVAEVPIEPGIFGIVRPVLLWPRGISERLTAKQADAILAHELCHVRRRDNLAAALHLCVQTIFWFHPLVWWIGARLVGERERACDEEVIRLGGEPETYAEGILKTCRFFVESPLLCVAGVTGSDLRRRIEAIMRGRPAMPLSGWRRLALAAVAVAAFTTPVLVGASATTRLVTQAVPASTRASQFEAATIRINTSGGGRGQIAAPAGTGRLTITNMPLRQLIEAAYAVQLPSQLANVPDWVAMVRVDVAAKAESPVPLPELQRMLQPLLAERFKLAVHMERQELDALALVPGNREGRLGPQMKPSAAACDNVGTTNRFALAPDAPGPAQPACGILPGGLGRIVARGIDVAALTDLLAPSQRKPVIDRTGLTGRFDIDVTYTPEAFSAASLAQRNGVAPPGVDPNGPPLATALLDQLGLRLEPTRAPIDVIVVDRIERLTGD